MTASQYMCDVQVEIAFDSGFATPEADRTWVDVSDYVELAAGIDTGVGRGDEFSVADANTLTLTLDNTGGRFTPEKVSGPYYPNVKIGRPIRVTATRVGGSAKERFVGYIDSWLPSSSGANPVMVVSATSQLARFGLASTLSGGENIADIFAGLEVLFPLCETGTEYADLRERLPDMTDVFVTLLPAAGLGPDGPETALRFASGGLATSTYTGGGSHPTGLLVDDPCVFELFVAPALGAHMDFRLTGNEDGSGTNDSIVLALSGDAVVNLASGGAVNIPVTYPTWDGSLHHIAIALVDDDATVYIDGVVAGSASGTGSVKFGNIVSIALDNSTGPVDVSYVAISNDVSTIAQRALAGLATQDQTASGRITIAAAAAGAQSTDIDATTDVLDGYSVIDKSLLDVLHAAETSDGGVLFDAPDGTLTFRKRQTRYNTTSAFTLDVSLQQVEASIAPKLDRSTLTNEVTVTRSDSDDFGRASDADSIADYGISRSGFEIQADADHCFQAAAWAVFLHGEPGTRIPNLEVDLLACDATLQDALLAATVGTHFTVSGFPAEFAASSLDFFVEGFGDAIGKESYGMTLNVSPRDPAKFNVWTLEDPNFGAYDSNPIAY